MFSTAAEGHTLVDIVVADPTRCDLVERTARQDLVAPTDAERRKKRYIHLIRDVLNTNIVSS